MHAFSVLHGLISSRRSIRQWLNDAVPREDLVRLVDCARLAPSDTNAQPWHFTVVTNRAVIRALEQATRERLDELGQALAAMGRSEAARKLKVFEKYGTHFGSAPALVLISGEPYDSRFMREIFSEILTSGELAQMAREESLKSTSLAAMNLLLAAHALGYGAVPMSAPVLLLPGELKMALGVPSRFEPHLLVALGRPATQAPPSIARKSLETVTDWIE